MVLLVAPYTVRGGGGRPDTAAELSDFAQDQEQNVQRGIAGG